jgi:hypothetical protein
MLVANSSLTVSTGKSIWFWACVIVGILLALYLAYTFFVKQSPPAEPTK